MKIFAKNGDSVKISIWKHKDGDGEFRPNQTYNAIKEFDIFINNKKITVYFNKSKSSVDYYYLRFNNLWNWTRDGNIKNYREYRT